MMFEYVALAPEQIERYRELATDIGDNACLVLHREAGYYYVAWEDDTTIYEYDPSTRLRRNRGKDLNCIWTEWA